MSGLDGRQPAFKHVPVKVTCTLITFNERDRIARAIASVRGIATEVLVIDSGSTDGTQAFCESLGARVVERPFDGFGPQKRFAEDQATHDIILNLDADEWLSEPLRAEIAALILGETLPARSYRMRMTMVYPHRERPAPFADFHNYVRFYDRRATRFADSLVHDEVPPTADAAQLRAPAYHQSFRSMKHLVGKELVYFRLQRQELRKNRLWLAARLPVEFPLQLFKYWFVRGHIFGGLYGIALGVALAFMRWMRLVILLRG